MNNTAETIPARLRVVANILATQNDFCLIESMEQLFKEGVDTFVILNPKRYWSGPTVPPDLTIELLKDLRELVTRHPGIKCFYMPALKQDYETTVSGGAREQAIRARMLEVSKSLFKADAVLVLDADELWLPGEYTRAREFFEMLPASAALSVGFQNVVGVPGWLVSPDDSSGVVLVRTNATFSGPRSVAATSRLEGDSVLHFTATRKTWPEVVSKYAASGHQGDPDYDFPKFLVKVGQLAQNPDSASRLVNFHPDLRSPQTWPAVRAFSAKELDALPARLRPYVHGELQA